MQKTHQEKIRHTKETQREIKQGGRIDINATEYMEMKIIIIRDGLESNQTEAPAHLTPIGAFVAALELQSVGILVDAAGDVAVDVEAAEGPRSRAPYFAHSSSALAPDAVHVCAWTPIAAAHALLVVVVVVVSHGLDCSTTETLRRVHLQLQFQTANLRSASSAASPTFAQTAPWRSSSTSAQSWSSR